MQVKNRCRIARHLVANSWSPSDRSDTTPPADRFAPEPVTARPRGLYKRFGTGERSCIGRQFALHYAVLTLGTLIRRYYLVADPNYALQIQEWLTLMSRDTRSDCDGADPRECLRSGAQGVEH